MPLTEITPRQTVAALAMANSIKDFVAKTDHVPILPTPEMIEGAAAALHEWDHIDHHFPPEPFAELPLSEQLGWRTVAEQILRRALNP